MSTRAAPAAFRRCRMTAMLLLLGAGAALAQPIDDAGFRTEYLRLYEALKGVAPNLVVMELRERVELVAGRGSKVGAASNDRRIRAFEAAMLDGLQGATCGDRPASPARPSPTLVEMINAAATAQRLRTKAADVAQLTALAQRLLESQPHERWCGLKSLDEIQ